MYLVRDLRPGDHIYVWRTFLTAYAHHGIVVNLGPCDIDCSHESSCCSVVHLVGNVGNLAKVKITSLKEFQRDSELRIYKYGVSSIEFGLKRPGTCSSLPSDSWFLVVLRALATVQPLDGADPRITYDVFTKNCELLATWCKLGSRSGLKNFMKPSERGYSNQSNPARWLPVLASGLLAVASAAPGVATQVARTILMNPGQTVAALSIFKNAIQGSSDELHESSDSTNHGQHFSMIPGILNALFYRIDVKVVPSVERAVSDSPEAAIALSEILCERIAEATSPNVQEVQEGLNWFSGVFETDHRGEDDGHWIHLV